MKTYRFFIVFLILFSSPHVFSQTQDDQPIISKGNFLPTSSKLRSFNRTDFDSKLKSSVIPFYSEDFSSIYREWTTEGSLSILSTFDSDRSILDTKSDETIIEFKENLNLNQEGRLISPSIQLPELDNHSSHIVLNFREEFSLESEHDFGQVEISTDNGETWVAIDIRTGTSEWISSTIFLDAYKGKEILLSFHYIPDETIPSDGWIIDDLNITLLTAATLDATLTSLSPHNFPYIYMNIAISEDGVRLNTLNQSNFQVYENNILQSDLFGVTPPDQGAGSRLADIVFLVDNSGSFRTYQNAVYNNMVSFIDQLKISDIDYALGLCRFGQSALSGIPIIEEAGQLTTNADNFKNIIWAKNVVDGRYEPAYDAITKSVSDFTFRPGSQKIFIILSDEDPDQGSSSQQDAINTVKSNSVTLFALTTPNWVGLNLVATESEGRYYNITDPFNDILDDISSIIGNSYLVQYKSSSPINDGIERNVRVDINYDASTTSVSGSYFPGSAPEIIITQACADLDKTAWAENTQFTIEANITDNLTPFVSSATIHYKNSLETQWKNINMSFVTGSLWTAQIPTADVLQPGLDFYITATDGQLTSSSPKVTPNSNPFQIGILPNIKPSINHTAITEFSIGSIINFTADIVDNTNSLDRVEIFIRNPGQLLYNKYPMNLSGGNNYSYDYPTNSKDNAGIEYYIAAWDNFYIKSSRGSADYPLIIILRSNELPEISHSQPSEYIVNGNTNITANATDSDGTVDEMRIYINDKNTSTKFASFLMSKESDNLWSYTFNATSSQNKGIDYYFSAEDNIGDIVYLRDNNPYILMPRPNEKPRISHTKVDEYIVGDKTDFVATITDPDGSIKNVLIYVKDLSSSTTFNAFTMNPIGGDNYKWTFNASASQGDGIVYYISAEDDWGDITLYQYSYPFKVNPVWISGFLIKEDAWSFNNSSQMWPYPVWSKIDYSPPEYPIGWRKWPNPSSSDFPSWDTWADAFGEKTCYYVNTNIFKFFNPHAVLEWSIFKRSWSGSCFGFAISSLLYFENYLSLQQDFPSNPSLFDVSLTEGSRNLINKYFVYQMGKEHLAYQSQVWNVKPTETLKLVKQSFINRQSFPLSLKNLKTGGGHAVVPYKVLKDIDNSDLEYIYVYDNNDGSNTNLRIQIDINKNEWSYNGLSSWGTDNQGLLPRLPSSDFINSPSLPLFEKKRLNFVDNNNFIFYNSTANNILIKDESGDQIELIDDDLNFIGETGYPIIFDSPESKFKDSPLFYLTEDNYEILLNVSNDSINRSVLFFDYYSFEYSSEFSSTNYTGTIEINNDTNFLSKKSVIFNEKIIYKDILQLGNYTSPTISFKNQNELSLNNKIKSIINSDIDTKVYTLNFNSLETDININIISDSFILLTNFTNELEYNINIYNVSNNKEQGIDYEKIILPSNSQHLIIPNWQSIETNGTLIFQGLNSDESFIDTVKLTTRINHSPSTSDIFMNMNENSPVDYFVTTVAGRDPDDGQDLTFSILEGNYEEAFRIDPFNGDIYVNNPEALNYEKYPEFNLLIEVRDNGQGFLSDTAMVTIKLIDLMETGIFSIPGIPSIQIYPNPFSVMFTIIAEQVEVTDLNIQLFDVINRIIFEKEYDGIQSLREDIDMTEYSGGLYFLKITGDSNSKTFKLIKE